MNDFYKQIIKFGLNRIRFYHNYVEHNVHLDHKGTQLEIDFLKEKFKNLKKDDEEILESYMNELDEIYNHKTRLDDEILLNHRKATIFLLFAYLEKQLEIFCNTIGKDSSFKISDLKGNSIFEKFKLYLKKLDRDFYNDVVLEINYFDKIRIIRNIITHQNDYLIKDDINHKKIKDFQIGKFEFKEYEGFENKTHLEIRLNNNRFIVEIFNNAETFFDKLYKS